MHGSKRPVGWGSNEVGDVAFAHDRLLNWAIAKSLFWQFQLKHLSLDGLAACLARETSEHAWYVSQQFGYVSMDTLWLLATDEANAQTLGQLVERMESSREFGSYGEDLYVHLLPTLGQRAVPVLLERLNAISTSSEEDYRVDLISKAFANLARQEKVDLKEVISLLLTASSRDRQNVAIAQHSRRRPTPGVSIVCGSFTNSAWTHWRKRRTGHGTTTTGVALRGLARRSRTRPRMPSREPHLRSRRGEGACLELGYLLAGLIIPRRPPSGRRPGMY